MANRKCLICGVCDRPVFDFDADTVKVARSWGFFVCGMAKIPHQDENLVRKTILVTDVNGTLRKDLFTKETVCWDLEVGM